MVMKVFEAFRQLAWMFLAAVALATCISGINLYFQIRLTELSYQERRLEMDEAEFRLLYPPARKEQTA